MFSGWTPPKPSDVYNRNNRMRYLHNPGCQCEHCNSEITEDYREHAIGPDRTECPDCMELTYNVALGVCEDCKLTD